MNKIHIFQCIGKIICVEFQRYPLKFHTKHLKPGLYSMRAYTRANADCRRSCLYFCRRLRPAHTRAYADCRRQSSNLLNFQGQRRPAQAFQPITKALQGHRGPTRRSDRDVCGRIPTHTLACLYFYPRRNLRYAVATHRQPQAWASAPAAGAYARMEYKPGFTHTLKDMIFMQHCNFKSS